MRFQKVNRKIIHVDMDAFFASIEQRDHPELRGKPVAVGGGGMRGVVAAASYEARKFGVRSAMPSVTAKRLCPELIFVKSNFATYKEVSQQVRDIFHSYTDLVQPLSLDEAYLDVTENKMGISSAVLIAERIRADIFKTTHLTASAGISYCKFLAKTASDINKPDGLCLITRDEAEEFLEKLPIRKFFGIGKVTAEKMKKVGIHNGADLKQRTEIELRQRFGKVGSHYYRIVRGIDDRPVNPHRIRKSIGAERTFSENLTRVEEMETKIDLVAEKVFDGMVRLENFGRTVTMKAKTPDFQIITRSKTFAREIRDLETLQLIGKDLLRENLEELPSVRLLGIAVSNLEKTQIEKGGGVQLEFEF